MLKKEVCRLAQKYTRPKQIIAYIVDYLKKIKVEVPAYNIFENEISTAYNTQEQSILEQLNKIMPVVQVNKIEALLPKQDKSDAYIRSELTNLRNIKQSLKPKHIKENVKKFIRIKKLFHEFEHTITNLQLSKEAIQYHGIWVCKAKTHQIYQLKDRHKKALYILCFIMHQYYLMHDLLMDIVIRAVKGTQSAVKQIQKDLDFEGRDQRNKAINKLSKFARKSKNIIRKYNKLYRIKGYYKRNRINGNH